MIVVGAGVSGLTSAIALAESGHDVQLWADRLPAQTTSAVAAAFWYPYRAFPYDRVLTWAQVAYRQFRRLCEVPGAGVRMVKAYDYARTSLPRPWWADAVEQLQTLPAEACPPGFSHGWSFDAPVIDTRSYLPYLQRRLAECGVEVQLRRIESLREALREGPVVNCSGLGAGPLCDDPEVYAVRGQLLHLENPGLQDVLLDEHDGGGIAYVVPRGDEVVLGGTARERDTDLAIRPDEADAIAQRCARLHPRLRDARRLRSVVGLRPGRASIRLEREDSTDGQVIHNYGHGGAGVTLSWGCAAEVVELAVPEIQRATEPST